MVASYYEKRLKLNETRSTTKHGSMKKYKKVMAW